MFGLSDNNDNKYADTTQVSASDATSLAPSQPDSNGGAGPSPLAAAGYPAPMPPAKHTSQASASSSPPAPVSGGMSDVSLENAYIDSPSPAASAKDASAQSHPTAASLVKNSKEDELLKLKQEALQSLAPLVDHLEQDPEAKFKTTMMMIQASDNADLIPEAYEAANKIQDEKVRAQALLDVVNEINYFTQHPTDTPQ
jgi:hypothetical protein